MVRKIVALLFCVWITAPLCAQTEKTTIADVRESLKAAGKHFRADELKPAQAALASAKNQLDRLPDDSTTQAAAKPLRKSWLKATKLVDEKLQDVDEKLAATAGISFATDLAPHLVDRCISCHGADRARQDLRVHTFAGLSKGGENGPIIDTFDAESSLMILKMKGESDGDRMPPNGDPLSDEIIAKFEQWIAAGAKFDGQDQAAPLTQIILSDRRAKLSASELTGAAKEAARRNWDLAYPGRKPTVTQTKNFLLVADKADASKLERAGEQAEEMLGESLKWLSFQKGTELKGALTLYVIPKQYDFAEWTQMVEKRTAVKSQSLHWHNDEGFGYVVAGPNSFNDKEELANESRLAQMVVSALLSRWGAPSWYAEGRGRYTRGQVNRRDPVTKSWKSAATRVLAEIKRPKEIFDGQLPTAQADVASWAFAAFLGSDQRRSGRLHAALHAGRTFDRSFAKSFGGTPQDVCDAWLKTFRRPGKRRK